MLDAGAEICYPSRSCKAPTSAFVYGLTEDDRHGESTAFKEQRNGARKARSETAVQRAARRDRLAPGEVPPSAYAGAAGDGLTDLGDRKRHNADPNPQENE